MKITYLPSSVLWSEMPVGTAEGLKAHLGRQIEEIESRIQIARNAYRHPSTPPAEALRAAVVSCSEMLEMTIKVPVCRKAVRNAFYEAFPSARKRLPPQEMICILVLSDGEVIPEEFAFHIACICEEYLKYKEFMESLPDLFEHWAKIKLGADMVRIEPPRV